MPKKAIVLFITALALALLFVSLGCGSGDTAESRRPGNVVDFVTSEDTTDGGNGGGGGVLTDFRCMVTYPAPIGTVCVGDTATGMTQQDCAFFSGTWEAGTCP